MDWMTSLVSMSRIINLPFLPPNISLAQFDALARRVNLLDPPSSDLDRQNRVNLIRDFQEFNL